MEVDMIKRRDIDCYFIGKVIKKNNGISTTRNVKNKGFN